MAQGGEFGDFLKYLTANPTALWSVLGSYVPVIGASWGAAWFLRSRDVAALNAQIAASNAAHQRDIARLEQLNEKSVKIIDADFPALNDLAPVPLPSGIADRLTYHADFGVITIEFGPWTFQQASHADVFEEWFGNALQTDPNLSAGYKFVSEDVGKPCLVWKGRGKSILNINNNRILKKMYPFIILRRVIDTSYNDVDYTTNEIFSFISWLTYWSAASKDISFKIQKMFRTKDTAYLRGYFEFRNITINEEFCERYYLLRQIVVKRIGAFRYTIYTGFPNANFDDPYSAHLKDWWDKFSIVE